MIVPPTLPEVVMYILVIFIFEILSCNAAGTGFAVPLILIFAVPVNATIKKF